MEAEIIDDDVIFLFEKKADPYDQIKSNIRNFFFF